VFFVEDKRRELYRFPDIEFAVFDLVKVVGEGGAGDHIGFLKRREDKKRII